MFKWLDDPDILEVRYCRPVAATFTFRDADGVERGFRLEAVADFVPAR